MSFQFPESFLGERLPVPFPVVTENSSPESLERAFNELQCIAAEVSEVVKDQVDSHKGNLYTVVNPLGPDKIKWLLSVQDPLESGEAAIEEGLEVSPPRTRLYQAVVDLTDLLGQVSLELADNVVPRPCSPASSSSSLDAEERYLRLHSIPVTLIN